jgi:hypothetical protein
VPASRYASANRKLKCHGADTWIGSMLNAAAESFSRKFPSGGETMRTGRLPQRYVTQPFDQSTGIALPLPVSQTGWLWALPCFSSGLDPSLPDLMTLVWKVTCCAARQYDSCSSYQTKCININNQRLEAWENLGAMQCPTGHAMQGFKLNTGCSGSDTGRFQFTCCRISP